jgi:putative hydrolase of the HAD superfamily
MIRGIIFDCFGVLYIDTSQHFYEHHVKNYEQLRPELLNLNKAADYGILSQEELNEAVSDLTGLDLPFVSEHIQGVHQRNDLLLEFAEGLRRKHKVGMLSNIGPGAMDSFFTKEERDQLFDAVVMSGEESMTKPNPYIFRLTAERLGLTPGECIVVDDKEENCAGADAAGMGAILYESNTQTMKEIARLLKDEDA